MKKRGKFKGFPGKPVEVTPLQVKVQHGNFEDAFRRFKLEFQREKVVTVLKERSSYEKPSDKKRRKKRESVQRRLMVEARERMMKSGEWEKRQKKKEQKRLKKIRERAAKRDGEL